jgi:hypothetical protein
MRGEYWTDAAGNRIPWVSARRMMVPGDKPHQFTRIVLGPASFSLPLPPLAAGLIAVTLVLLAGYFLFARALRGKAAEHAPENTNKSS